MGNRRNRPPNRFGCKPTEDVCVEHDLPLDCKHGCYKAKEHKCWVKEQPGWYSAAPKEREEK
jgi:hypothetical protein